jgi:hypothetical protein
LFSRWRSSDLVKYWFVLIVMAVLFSATVRWQSWISRFHLPFFILGSAWIATMLERILSFKGRVIIVVFLIIAAVPFVINGYPRRLVGKKAIIQLPREQRYFVHSPPTYFFYKTAADLVKHSGCKEVGLMIGSDDWESPLWPMLDVPGSGIRLEHVFVSNGLERVKYPLGDFTPCAIIDIGGLSNEPLQHGFRPVMDIKRGGDHVVVYGRARDIVQ